MSREQLPLIGLVGSHPLAFLAAVGTLRMATAIWPDRQPNMHWEIRDSAWRPVVSMAGDMPRESFVDGLHQALRGRATADEFNRLGDDNFKVPPNVFRDRLALPALEHAADNSDRRLADFVAAFGSDGVVDRRNGNIECTPLRMMDGSSRQNFLDFVRTLIACTDARHLQTALFEPWTYADDRPSMRWDPRDDRRWALRAFNPSDGTRSPISTVRGANRLAIEALPAFVTVPVNGRLATRCFARVRRDVFFCWPIWQPPLSLDSMTTLFGHAQIIEASPSQDHLLPLGVREVYRAQRISPTTYLRNFAAASPCWGRLPTDLFS